MIQELLGGAALLGGERKFSINGGVILEGTPSSSPCLSPSPSPSTSASTSTTSTVATAATTAAATTTTSANSENQNLRCPRCDSSNTKFCYYNNYNLTQPRHFCKTCRRYWTKGGALRNVPIGGGCRKNKNSTISSSVSKANATKFKTLASDITRSSLFGGFDHEFSPNPILWASPQNSHILALLRANQNPNPSPSPNPSPISLKEEVNMIGAHVIPESGISMGAMNARNLNIDPVMNQLPTLGLCSSFWRNNQVQSPQYLQNQLSNQQQQSVVIEEQNSGMQALYQRLRASTGNYYTDHSPIAQSSIATSSSSPSPILESAPTAAGELTGYWNPTQLCWSDLPTTNGAYP